MGRLTGGRPGRGGVQDAWLTALPPCLCGRVCSPPLHACNAWLVKAMAGSGNPALAFLLQRGEGGEAASGPCRRMRSGRRHRGGGALTQSVSGLITAASGAPLPAGRCPEDCAEPSGFCRTSGHFTVRGDGKGLEEAGGQDSGKAKDRAEKWRMNGKLTDFKVRTLQIVARRKPCVLA